MSNIIPFLPGVTPSVIPEDEVTTSRLSSVLESVFMEHEVDDDGQIYVSEGVEFHMWIEVLAHHELLNFFTYWSVASQPEANWIARVNDLNSQIMLPQFSYGRKCVWGAYWMTYSGGLNARQFVKMLRNFSSAFVAGLSAYRDENREASTPQLSFEFDKPQLEGMMTNHKDVLDPKYQDKLEQEHRENQEELEKLEKKQREARTEGERELIDEQIKLTKKIIKRLKYMSLAIDKLRRKQV